MQRKRRSGFTLIELLVVIAIIAILAAMLFPVFARARESARKIQCLSNVKNISLAVQMYLSDYDRFPPTEHRQEALDAFDGCMWNAIKCNPYLRWPVIFDEYVKNRDVWVCPSAVSGSGAAGTLAVQYINPCIPDWLTAFKNAEAAGQLNCNDSPGNSPFLPNGWGGTVTDSFTQPGCPNVMPGGFAQSIGTNVCNLQDQKVSTLEDSAKAVVVADAGSNLLFDSTEAIAYPDIFKLRSAGCDNGSSLGASCDYDFISECGANDVRYGWDATYRQQHAHPRHMGGSNVGFADGHASWLQSERILFGSNWAHNLGFQPNSSAPLQNIEICGVFAEQVHW